MGDEQITFFSDNENQAAEPGGGKIDVVKLDFVEGQTTTWKELFSGYSCLKAITFSSGIGFIGSLVKLFEDAEILLGCEQVMSFDLSSILAFQTKTIESIRKSKSSKYLMERIEDNSLRFYVAREKMSHEKLYLLSSDDGRKRVVFGSANMSYQAFSGHQRENIAYIDGDEAYEWYSAVFQSLKESCTDEITRQAVRVADDCENIGEIPISNTIKANKVMVIEKDAASLENVEFALDVANLAERYKVYTPKADKKGIVRVTPTNIVTMKNQIKEGRDEQALRQQQFPQLILDISSHTATLNGERLDLNPAKEDIRSDVSFFLQYMKGYERFYGDYQSMQSRYYEFANWFFCSPFMAQIRREVHKYDADEGLLPYYPVFGVVCGKSKAGKTTFLKTLLAMMIGQKPIVANNEFTRTNINGLRCEVKGAPIIVDDLVRDKFNQHAVEVIKNDYFGLRENLPYYPAVVISANEDVKVVSSQVTRRTIVCNVQAGITNTQMLAGYKVMKIQSSLGTALYREYVRRMFDLLPEMLEQMGEIVNQMKKEDDEEEQRNADELDVLKLSSEVLYDIITENIPEGEEVPFYIRKLTISDYINEKITGRQVIQAITTAWKTSRNCFVVKKRANELRYNAGQNYEAERIIKELPENLSASRSREWVIMKLDEAENFFEINFKKSLFGGMKR